VILVFFLRAVLARTVVQRGLVINGAFVEGQWAFECSVGAPVFVFVIFVIQITVK
jgi:hypothetical protein